MGESASTAHREDTGGNATILTRRTGIKVRRVEAGTQSMACSVMAHVCVMHRSGVWMERNGPLSDSVKNAIRHHNWDGTLATHACTHTDPDLIHTCSSDSASQFEHPYLLSSVRVLIVSPVRVQPGRDEHHYGDNHQSERHVCTRRTRI